MVYEMIGATLHFVQGQTYSSEELAEAGCDLAWLEKTGTIRPVGFIATGQPRTESEQAQIVADLQRKLETMEDERDAARAEVKDAKNRIKVLEDGHRVGMEQLRAAEAKAAKTEAELKILREREEKAKNAKG